MKFKVVILFLAIFSKTTCFGQEVIGFEGSPDDTSSVSLDTIKYTWKNRVSYALDANEVWSVDGIGNVFTSKEGVINKYDTIGGLRFSQSIKSMGNMSQMLPINSMKLVHFSEEQQTLCYLDNTLSQTDDCLELADRDIVNASMVAASSRPDLIWVFDNLNSKLILMALDRASQKQQEIENLSGILDINNISQILERESKLYLVDDHKGVYVFDIYGSLLNHYDQDSINKVDVREQVLYMLFDKILKRTIYESDYQQIIPLPMEGITDFRYSNQHYYFRTSQHVHKFSLQITK
jgi:hypothetical protein